MPLSGYADAKRKSEVTVTQKELDGYVSNKEAATIFKRTPARMQQLAQEGRLPHLNTPIGRLFPRAELEALAAQREAKGGELAA
jgi:helix-turn-helix protein